MLSFNNSPGNLYNWLGKAGVVIKQMDAFQANQNTSLVDPSAGLSVQLVAQPDIQSIITSSYIGQLNSIGSVGGLMQNVSAQMLNRMVFLDTPQPNQGPQTLNVLASLQELIRQMKAAGASVLAMTITPTVNAFVGRGNGVITMSTKRPLDGLVLENSFTETVTYICTQDSYQGRATQGNEVFSVNGEAQQGNVFAYNWPEGSGAQTFLNAINGNASNAQGNYLSNSNFANWSNGVPNGFTLNIGTPGININQEMSVLYDGTSALRITGDAGGTKTQLSQPFGTTASPLSPLTQYSFNIFARRDGTVPGAGQMFVELVDQNGVQVLDANGVANVTTINLTALTTVYGAFNVSFRTPLIMPQQMFWQLRMNPSSVLTNGRSVYFAKASMGQMIQLATGCPFIALHAGSIPFIQGDYSHCQIANSRGAGGVLDTFQTLLYRLFPLIASNELLIPSSATPTISDSLIS